MSRSSCGKPAVLALAYPPCRFQSHLGFIFDNATGAITWQGKDGTAELARHVPLDRLQQISPFICHKEPLIAQGLNCGTNATLPRSASARSPTPKSAETFTPLFGDNDSATAAPASAAELSARLLTAMTDVYKVPKLARISRANALAHTLQKVP
jgi:hypothetical protein